MFMHVVNMSMHVVCRVAQVCCNAHGVQRTWHQYSLSTGGGGLLRGKLKSLAYVAILQPLKKIWFYRDKVSFCGSDWPKTQSKAQTGLKGDA